MSTKHAELLHAVQKGKQMYAAFAEGEALLQTLTGLEQNERELRASVEKLQKEHGEIQSKLDTAKSEAMVTVRLAKDDAKGIVDAANQKANKIVANATNIAVQTEATAKAVVEEAVTARDAIRKEYDDLAARIVLNKATLDSIEGKLAKAREAAAAIVSG